MGLDDVVERSKNHSVTVTVAMMEDILKWLSENDDLCYPSLSDVGEDEDLRPQEVNAAVEQLDIPRWNTDSNSNIRIVNPAAFEDKQLPELEE